MFRITLLSQRIDYREDVTKNDDMQKRTSFKFFSYSIHWSCVDVLMLLKIYVKFENKVIK